MTESLMETRILERIKQQEEKLLKHMKDEPSFLEHHTFYMIGASINELYLLLTSYKNEHIIKKREHGRET